MTLSYFVGQKKNPIPYPVKDITTYFIAAMAAYAMMRYGQLHFSSWVSFVWNNVMILTFIFRIVKCDMPLSSLPVIGKKFKKK